MVYKLVIFDVDGTLVTTTSGETFRKRADDWQWLPGRVEHIKQMRAEGVRVAIASNQGGVAFGYMQQSDVLRELSRMVKEAGIAPGGLYICYTHPKASVQQYKSEDTRRKPGPGMLQDAMRDFDALPEETLMVGDRPEDEQAAKSAGVAFTWADDFFAVNVFLPDGFYDDV